MWLSAGLSDPAQSWWLLEPRADSPLPPAQSSLLLLPLPSPRILQAQLGGGSQR